MKVFELVNSQPRVTTEALLTFSDLYNRDTSKNKDRFYQEMLYVYFYTDYKSYYNGIAIADREKEIIKQYIKIPGWKPDNEVKRAIEIYKQLQKTESLGLLEDARYALEKIRGYYKSIDFNKRDTKGNQLFKITDVTRSVGDIAKMIESLDKLTDKVRKEEELGRRSRGEGEGGFFESK